MRRVRRRAAMRLDPQQKTDGGDSHAPFQIASAWGEPSCQQGRAAFEIGLRESQDGLQDRERTVRWKTRALRVVKLLNPLLKPDLEISENRCADAHSSKGRGKAVVESRGKRAKAAFGGTRVYTEGLWKRDLSRTLPAQAHQE